jgi:hypothetical protein
MPAFSRAIESNLTPQRVVAQWTINLDEPVCPSTLHLMAAGIVHQKRNGAEPIGDFRRQAMHCCQVSNVDPERRRIANFLRCSE